MYTTVFVIGGKKLVSKQMPENVLAIPVTPAVLYATPSTTQFAENTVPLVHGHIGCLMEMHGIPSWGGSLLMAYQSMERSEYMV